MTSIKETITTLNRFINGTSEHTYPLVRPEDIPAFECAVHNIEAWKDVKREIALLDISSLSIHEVRERCLDIVNKYSQLN